MTTHPKLFGKLESLSSTERYVAARYMQASGLLSLVPQDFLPNSGSSASSWAVRVQPDALTGQHTTAQFPLWAQPIPQVSVLPQPLSSFFPKTCNLHSNCGICALSQSSVLLMGVTPSILILRMLSPMESRSVMPVHRKMRWLGRQGHHHICVSSQLSQQCSFQPRNEECSPGVPCEARHVLGSLTWHLPPFWAGRASAFTVKCSQNF